MSLAELAEREGLKPKRVSPSEWLDEHPELVAEIKECREKGYAWTAIMGLLRKHYEYPGSAHEALRDAMANR